MAELAASAWWPVALAEEISGKPRAVFVDSEAIVLFRDEAGAVRALENRCPHRRAPLSLGSVRAEGWIQCGYHGWAFDGATGRCKAIPNLRADEPVPSTYGVYAYRVAEQGGMVYVAAGKPACDPPEALYALPGRSASARPLMGRQIMGMGHDEFIAALMDGPHLMLRCPGMRVAETMSIDPHWEEGWLMMERPAFLFGQSTFDAFVREYKLLFRLAVRRHTGESWMAFVRPDGTVIAAAHWAVTPSTRGTTAIVWRSFAPKASGVRPALLHAATAFGHAPIAPSRHINMAAVTELLVGPSEYWPRDRKTSGLFGQILTTKKATT